MIIYNNRDIRFIFFKLSGSVLLSRIVLLPALLSTAMCAVLLHETEKQGVQVVSVSPDVARVYATILGFVIVFRTRLAFDRFFEGVSHVQMMFSKWRDTFSALCAFIECSIKQLAKKGDSARVQELMLSKARLLHWFSIVAALAVQELQMSPEMDEDPWQAKQQQDRKSTKNTSLGYVSGICVLNTAIDRISHQVAATQAHPDRKPPRSSGLASTLEQSHLKGDIHRQGDVRDSYTLIPATARGLKSIAVSSFVSCRNFTSSSSSVRKSDSRKSTKHHIEQEKRAVYVIGEITPTELDQINRSHDRVLTAIKWILQEVSEHAITGKLLIAPPILSRVYQELSIGMLASFMAKMKIAVVPFPFPFAQVVSYALYMFYFLCPFIALEIMSGKSGEQNRMDQSGVPLLLNFAACAGYAALNEIAIELEEPFGFDVNDYPVHCQQNLIVRAMEDIYFCRAPDDLSQNAQQGAKKEEIQ